MVDGNNQTGPVNTTLPLPLEVIVGEVLATGSGGKGRVGTQALDGVPVTFTVTSGGGSLASATATTDASGNAQTRWTLGTSTTASARPSRARPSTGP